MQQRHVVALVGNEPQLPCPAAAAASAVVDGGHFVKHLQQHWKNTNRVCRVRTPNGIATPSWVCYSRALRPCNPPTCSPCCLCLPPRKDRCGLSNTSHTLPNASPGALGAHPPTHSASKQATQLATTDPPNQPALLPLSLPAPTETLETQASATHPLLLPKQAARQRPGTAARQRALWG